MPSPHPGELAFLTDEATKAREGEVGRPAQAGKGRAETWNLNQTFQLNDVLTTQQSPHWSIGAVPPSPTAQGLTASTIAKPSSQDLTGIGSNAKGHWEVTSFSRFPCFFIPQGAISWLTPLEGTPGSSVAQKETVHWDINDANMGNQSYLL